MKKPNYRYDNVKLLIADDTTYSLEILRGMLAIYGIVPEEVKDGNKVIERLKEESFDLLILDIHMPNKSGLDVVQEVRQMDIQQPVIVSLTASALKQEVEEYYKAGFDDHVPKPVEMAQIEEVLLKYLSHKLSTVEPSKGR